MVDHGYEGRDISRDTELLGGLVVIAKMPCDLYNGVYNDSYNR